MEDGINNPTVRNRRNLEYEVNKPITGRSRINLEDGINEPTGLSRINLED